MSTNRKKSAQPPPSSPDEPLEVVTVPVSVRLPANLVKRLDEFVQKRLNDVAGCLVYNRSMAIQELLHTSLAVPQNGPMPR